MLQAVGRTPNGKKIAADKAGVAVTDCGFINVDIQMRTNVAHIFAIGDIVGQPMLAHKAVHEAHVAAEVIAGELQGNKDLASAAFNARVIPSVAYTDPEVAWVGLTEDQAKAQGIKVKKGLFAWTASGRAIANGRDEGVTKLLFDDSPEAHGHDKILGGIVGTHAGDMIGEIALAIEAVARIYRLCVSRPNIQAILQSPSPCRFGLLAVRLLDMRSWEPAANQASDFDVDQRVN